MVKQEVLRVINATKPMNLLFGTVTSMEPIGILVEQKLPLTKEFLVLTERVTRYEVDLEHDHTNSGGVTTKGLTDLLTKTPIRTGLKVGDEVALLRMQGGDKYLVIDKVVQL